MNTTEHLQQIKTLVQPSDDKWHRYHYRDVEVGDTVRLQNGATGTLSLVENRLTLTVTAGSRPPVWTLFPDPDGWLPNVAEVHRIYEH
jgi:hypothetical protein